MTCDELGEPGGYGCVRRAWHDGDHRTVEGATWPQVEERECPRCGGQMWEFPTTPADQICIACQEEDEPVVWGGGG